ncbi:MAG: four-helix bundle copper-binding protein [Chthoniobacterales bacterium]
MWPPKFSDCIDACNVARRRSERVVTAGLAQSDVNTVASVIVIARDCARIATLTTQLLERGSKYAYPICDVCARACEELAKACDNHSKIEAFSRCAEACRKCAQECAKLAKAKKPAR